MATSGHVTKMAVKPLNLPELKTPRCMHFMALSSTKPELLTIKVLHFGTHERCALWLLICCTLEKHLLTYLLTYVAGIIIFVLFCCCNLWPWPDDIHVWNEHVPSSSTCKRKWTFHVKTFESYHITHRQTHRQWKHYDATLQLIMMLWYML